MAIKTWSAFLYGFEVDETNRYVDFKEGASAVVKSASLAVGSYTATEFLDALVVAMNEAGELVYSAAVNRLTRKITVSASGAFTILSGDQAPHDGSLALDLMGFTQRPLAANQTSYLGASAVGQVYRPQFLLQEYISSDDYQQALDASVNKTASGRVEVVTFGVEKFIELNVKFITDIPQGGEVIRSNPQGVSDAREFLRFATKKAPFEFIPNEDAPDTFEKVILESTPTSSNGVGYRLSELYDRGLPGYFETGRLKLRVIE